MRQIQVMSALVLVLPCMTAQSGGPELDPKLIHHLVLELATHNSTTRLLAAERLERLGPRAGPIAVPYLETVVKHSKDGQVVFTAVRVLGKMGVRAIPVLETTLAHKDWSIRAAAAAALGRIGPGARRAARVLCGALDDHEEEVRREAARALGQIGARDRKVQRALKKRLRAAKGRERITVAWAILKLGKGKGTMRVLIRGLHSPKVVLRITAAEALRTLGTQAFGAKRALERATNDTDDDVRLLAARALAGLGGIKRPVEVFRVFLGHKNPVYRLKLARVMGEFPKLRSRTVPLLLLLLSDPDPIVKQEARKVLARLRSATTTNRSP